MNLCQACSINIPESWSYCSSDCSAKAATQSGIAATDSAAPPAGLLNTPQLAAHTGISTQTIRALRIEGILKAHRYGGAYYFDPDEAIAAIRANGTAQLNRKLDEALVPKTERPAAPAASTPPPFKLLPGPSQEIAEMLVVESERQANWSETVGRAREQMLIAAREAARDVILQLADEAKRRARHDSERSCSTTSSIWSRASG
jgi:hypothetical protein